MIKSCVCLSDVLMGHSLLGVDGGEVKKISQCNISETFQDWMFCALLYVYYIVHVLPVPYYFV